MGLWYPREEEPIRTSAPRIFNNFAVVFYYGAIENALPEIVDRKRGLGQRGRIETWQFPCSAAGLSRVPESFPFNDRPFQDLEMSRSGSSPLPHLYQIPLAFNEIDKS